MGNRYGSSVARGATGRTGFARIGSRTRRDAGTRAAIARWGSTRGGNAAGSRRGGERGRTGRAPDPRETRSVACRAELHLPDPVAAPAPRRAATPRATRGAARVATADAVIRDAIIVAEGIIPSPIESSPRCADDVTTRTHEVVSIRLSPPEIGAAGRDGLQTRLACVSSAWFFSSPRDIPRSVPRQTSAHAHVDPPRQAPLTSASAARADAGEPDDVRARRHSRAPGDRRLLPSFPFPRVTTTLCSTFDPRARRDACARDTR